MKVFILSLLLLAQVHAAEKDKALHFVATLGIAGATSGIARSYGSSKLEAFAIGVASALLIGVAKEAIDGGGHGSEDINDIYADAAGALVGASIFSWSF